MSAYTTPGGISVTRGCFEGTLDEFEAAVRETGEQSMSLLDDILDPTFQHVFRALDEKRAAATGPECNRAAPEGSPDDAGTAGVVSSEPTMGDNGFASFSRDVKAIEANMINTQQLLREATIELNVRQTLIEQYRSDKYAHQRLIGKLLELLNNDDLDAARDLVKDEYDAIHGVG